MEPPLAALAKNPDPDDATNASASDAAASRFQIICGLLF
jgi:hypothetical protein